MLYNDKVIILVASEFQLGKMIHFFSGRYQKINEDLGRNKTLVHYDEYK